MFSSKILTVLTNARRISSIKIGDKASIKRRISMDDAKAFSELTQDYNPIHIDSDKGIVHGAFLNALVSGVIGTKLPGFGTVVVEQMFRFPKPCFINEEVIVNVEVSSIRKLVQVDYEVFVDDFATKEKRVVLQGYAKLMLPKEK